MDCIFCKIVNAEIPATIIYQDEQVIAFDDIYPKAPQHKLIIPRRHIATVNDLTPEDGELVGHMTLTAKNIAKQLGIADSGYRIVLNCNQEGGQEIYHIHLHLIGGKQLSWPPG